MYTNRAHCRALRLMFALRKEQAYFINLNGICLRLRPKGVQGASGKPPASGMIRQLCRNQFPVGGIDAPTLARVVGLPPRGGKYFLSLRKKVPKKASGTATPEAARPAARYSQISAFRALPCPALVFAQACQSLTAYGSCAHWARAPSRPKLRSAVAPSGLSSSTGCPVSHSSLPVALLASHPPCGSLWAAPKAPLGPRFPSGQFAALTRREKALYCPFLKEGVRNVAHNGVG